MFDVVFSGIVVFFGYTIVDAHRNGRRIVIESASLSCGLLAGDVSIVHSDGSHPKKVYRLQELYSMKHRQHRSSPWYEYRVETRRDMTPTLRYSTPDHSRVQQDLMQDGTSSSSPYSASYIDRKEQYGYALVMKEMESTLSNGGIEILPKDIHMGRVVWMKDGCGLIRTVDPVLKMSEFFFHLCTRSLGESDDSLCVGDRVMFSLALSDKRLRAVEVRHVAGRTISSPDFSRLVMRRSKQAEVGVDSFEL